MILNLIYYGTVLGIVLFFLLMVIWNAKVDEKLVHTKPIKEIHIVEHVYTVKSELTGEEEEVELSIKINTELLGKVYGCIAKEQIENRYYYDKKKLIR